MRNTFDHFDEDKLRELLDEKRALYFRMLDSNKEFAELKQLFKEIKELLKILQEKRGKRSFRINLLVYTSVYLSHNPFQASS